MPGIREAEQGKLTIVTSALTLAETLYLVKTETPVSSEVRRKVRDFFESDFIQLAEVDRVVAEKAQDVVWDHAVQHKDAIHVATALLARRYWPIEQLDTFDGPLQQLSGVIESLPIGEPTFQTDLESDAVAHGRNGHAADVTGASLEGEANP